MFLLDTSQCSAIHTGQPGTSDRLKSLDRSSIATCVIVVGELYYMAQKSERPDLNVPLIESLILSMRVLSIDPETPQIYGNLKGQLLGRFGPRERAKRRRFDPIRLGFTDHDLWIAAHAIQHELTLVTADKDFQRIAQVQPLSIETWWSPAVPPPAN